MSHRNKGLVDAISVMWKCIAKYRTDYCSVDVIAPRIE